MYAEFQGQIGSFVSWALRCVVGLSRWKREERKWQTDTSVFSHFYFPFIFLLFLSQSWKLPERPWEWKLWLEMFCSSVIKERILFLFFSLFHYSYNKPWIMKYVWVWTKPVRIRFSLFNTKKYIVVACA